MTRAEYDATTLQLAQRRLEGASLQTLADELGVSRQAVDQRIRNLVGDEAVSSITVVARQRASHDKEVAKGDNRRESLRSVVPQVVHPRNTDEEMLEALRRFARRYGAPVTITRLLATPIEDREGCPTPAIYYRRFGTWVRACELAGIEANPPNSGRRYYRSWSEQEIEEILLEFAREMLRHDVRPTAAAYMNWSATRRGDVPSLATIRNVFIRWNLVMERVLARV